MTSAQGSVRLRVLEEREVEETETEAAPAVQATVRQPQDTAQPQPAAPTLTPQQMAQLRLIDAQIKAANAKIAREQQMIARISAALRFAASILMVRMLLLLTLTGAFALATMAVQTQTWISVAVLAAYCLLVLMPTVYVETRTSGPPQQPQG